MTDALHDRWTAARDSAVWADHGTASLAATHWLDGTARTFDEAPGTWRTDGSAAIGEGVPGLADPVRLAPGEETLWGDLLLRAIERDNAIAVRVFDPSAAEKRGISEIMRFPFDPTLRVIGRFTASAHTTDTLAVDGHESTTTYDGVVSFEVNGTTAELTVERDGDRLFAAFADATSGSESYPFRFIAPPLPDEDGTVRLDLNRAYLPPCAFSDHYVCVFPPAENRWRIPVRGGERLPR